MQYVTIADRDPAPVIVKTGAGATIEGELIARGDVSIDTLLFENQLRLWPLPTDVDRSPLIANVRRGFVQFDGRRFTIDGVTGPGRFVLPRPPEGTYLQSVTVNGRDALNDSFDFGMRGERFSGVEVVLSGGAATVTGQVLDARGSVAATAAVMVFTTDRSLWFRESQHVAIGRPGRDGVFRVGNLPPGEYFVAAFEPSDEGYRVIEWHDTTLLDALASRAERITLGERETYRGTFRLTSQR
jgi:hypothetical protein